LQRAIETASSTACQTILVVLRAHANIIAPTINNTNVNVIENADWNEGIASSIKSGITEIQKINPAVNSVILMTCDQPFVDTHIFNMLILSKTKSGIAACRYNNFTGMPALFDSVYFNELAVLDENEGVETLLIKHSDILTTIPFEQGSVDIDTMADFDSLNRS
jgi:molybdenum cofactor cytidylyltransferase